MGRDNGANMHIVYWDEGINLRRGGYGICAECKGVSKPWSQRLDNLQAAIRSCGKEGSLFRRELEDMLCLSPQSALFYRMNAFAKHLDRENKKALTEEVVLGTAIRVARRELAGREAGVFATHLGQEYGWAQYFREHVESLASWAAKEGGRLVVIILDGDGEELQPLEIGAQPLADGAQKPISRVLVLLGGPSGISSHDLRSMEKICSSVASSLVRVKLPGGKQHSNVALADLLMANERRWLLPAVDQLLRFGRRYGEFRDGVRELLAQLRGPRTAEDAMKLLRGLLREARREQEQDLCNGVRVRQSSWWKAAETPDGPRNEPSSAAADPVATPGKPNGKGRHHSKASGQMAEADPAQPAGRPSGKSQKDTSNGVFKAALGAALGVGKKNSGHAASDTALDHAPVSAKKNGKGYTSSSKNGCKASHAAVASSRPDCKRNERVFAAKRDGQHAADRAISSGLPLEAAAIAAFEAAQASGASLSDVNYVVKSIVSVAAVTTSSSPLDCFTIADAALQASRAAGLERAACYHAASEAAALSALSNGCSQSEATEVATRVKAELAYREG